MAESAALAGTSFVLLGRFPRDYPTDYIKRIIERHGGAMTPLPTRKTTHIVLPLEDDAKLKDSNKYKKAKEKNPLAEELSLIQVKQLLSSKQIPFPPCSAEEAAKFSAPQGETIHLDEDSGEVPLLTFPRSDIPKSSVKERSESDDERIIVKNKVSKTPEATSDNNRKRKRAAEDEGDDKSSQSKQQRTDASAPQTTPSVDKQATTIHLAKPFIEFEFSASDAVDSTFKAAVHALDKPAVTKDLKEEPDLGLSLSPDLQEFRNKGRPPTIIQQEGLAPSEAKVDLGSLLVSKERLFDFAPISPPAQTTFQRWTVRNPPTLGEVVERNHFWRVVRLEEGTDCPVLVRVPERLGSIDREIDTGARVGSETNTVVSPSVGEQLQVEEFSSWSSSLDSLVLRHGGWRLQPFTEMEEYLDYRYFASE